MNSSGSSRAGFPVFHSLSSGSGDSIDDDYMELMDMESIDDDMGMPNDLNSLICKDIKSSKTPDNKRSDSFVRKCLNMDGNVKNSLFSSPSTPKTSSTITSLITTPERQCLQSISENITPFGYRSATTGAFKRPEPPTMSPIQSKRHKSENEPPVPANLMPFAHPHAQQKRPILRKSMSMNDAVIDKVLLRSSSESNLIGDFSRPFVLPLVEGRHNDLKSITADTMRKLLLGEFDDQVSSYKIIDCRYPYEFEGGHIRGALNLYTHEQVLEELVTKKTESNATDGKRDILVFHCEFSSERGPKL
jgi:M-phase inducer phosphatase 2